MPRFSSQRWKVWTRLTYFFTHLVYQYSSIEKKNAKEKRQTFKNYKTHHKARTLLLAPGSTRSKDATRNKCIATSNKCLTRNKKLLETSASLLGARTLLGWRPLIHLPCLPEIRCAAGGPWARRLMGSARSVFPGSHSNGDAKILRSLTASNVLATASNLRAMAFNLVASLLLVAGQAS